MAVTFTDLFVVAMCDLGRKGTLLWRKIKADNVLNPYFPSFFHFFSKNCKKNREMLA